MPLSSGMRVSIFVLPSQPEKGQEQEHDDDYAEQYEDKQDLNDIVRNNSHTDSCVGLVLIMPAVALPWEEDSDDDEEWEGT